MIANNIFRWIGNLFTNFLFKPYDWIRGMDNWWIQNFFNWILIIIGVIFFIYWLGQLKIFGKEVQ